MAKYEDELAMLRHNNPKGPFSQLSKTKLDSIKKFKPGIGKLALPFIAAPIAGTLAYKALDSM